MASKTLAQFTKNLAGFDGDIVDSTLLRQWEDEVTTVMSDAQDKAPLASGQLVRSAMQQKATTTKNGIKSSYEFTVPYARKLNDKKSGVRLKEKNELSYTDEDGVKWKKAKKGELGYSDNAVESAESKDSFGKIVDSAISRAWRKL